MSRGAKIAIAVIGVAVVAIVVVVVVMVEHLDDGTHAASKQVAFDDLTTFDAAVVLPADADEHDVADVAGDLDASDAVVRFATPTPAQLLLNVSLAPASQDKLVREQLCNTPTIRSFVIALNGENADTRLALARAAGPSATIEMDASRRQEAEIFMRVKATLAESDAVAEKLKVDTRVKSYEFLDHNDAYDEFRRLFVDRPKLLRGAKPNGLPESFRLTLREGTPPKVIAASYEHRAGVDSVMYPSKYSGTSSPSTQLERLCAEALSDS